LKLLAFSSLCREHIKDSATALLPNVVGALVYGRSHHPVNRRSGFALHIWHHVAVNIHRDGDRGMSQAFLHDLGVDIRRWRGCAVGRAGSFPTLSGKPKRRV
jgi:hypothetical protein